MSDPKTGGPRRGCSTGGARLGAALSRLADKHRQPDDPDPCATCGLKEGTLPNMVGSTMVDAMHVLQGQHDAFCCHHGMEDGEPTRACARYIAASRATSDELLEALRGVVVPPDDRPENDPVGVYVKQWAAKVDPERKMDSYQLARAWERDKPHKIPTASLEPAK